MFGLLQSKVIRSISQNYRNPLLVSYLSRICETSSYKINCFILDTIKWRCSNQKFVKINSRVLCYCQFLQKLLILLKNVRIKTICGGSIISRKNGFEKRLEYFFDPSTLNLTFWINYGQSRFHCWIAWILKNTCEILTSSSPMEQLNQKHRRTRLYLSPSITFEY